MGLAKDVPLPGPLCCPEVYENLLIMNVMWFSSGGTKSVVHTDSAENIMCLYQGRKQFVMVDPNKYPDKVKFDHPESAYSSLDVDNVDYDSYPELLDIEYYHVSLSAGDCLYIPFHWIHQVRSYSRNIAVNVWFDSYGSHKVDLDSCADHAARDKSLSLADVEFFSFEHFMHQPEALRDLFHENSIHRDLTLDEFIDLHIGANPSELVSSSTGHELPLKKIFRMIDMNRDGVLHPNEILAVEEEDWDKISELVIQFETIMAAIEEEELSLEQYLESLDGESLHDEL